jgi:hypothetical protein
MAAGPQRCTVIHEGQPVSQEKMSRSNVSCGKEIGKRSTFAMAEKFRKTILIFHGFSISPCP